MDAREQIKRAILLLPKLATESESKEIKADIDLLTGVASQLVTALVSRNDALAKQCRSRKSKPPKPAPQKQPQQQKPKQSNAQLKVATTALRAVLRRFRQFSREFVKLSRHLQISNKHCVGMSMELRMMKLRFAKLQKRLHDERQANPKPEEAPRQSL